MIKILTADREKLSRILALTVASAGHFSFHYIAAMYAAIVIALADSWQMNYDILITLWLPASIAIGALAIPAGHLGDRWSFRGSLVIMFFGVGIFSIAAAFATNTTMMTLALLLMAAFGAIYHPVAIPWVMRLSSQHVGRNLAINGVFGSLGMAGAGSITGLIMALSDWKMAFIIPGIFNIICGIIAYYLIKQNMLAENKDNLDDVKKLSEKNQYLNHYKKMLIFCLLIILWSLLVGGIIYNTLQTAMPKLFADELTPLLGSLENALHMVGVVYFVGAFMQIIGGILSDKISVKLIYIVGWAIQAPFLLLVATGDGLEIMTIILVINLVNVALQPSENILLARLTPAKYHGLIFGVKFVLVFGAGPISVFLVSLSQKINGNFDYLFSMIGLSGITVLLLLFFMPQNLIAKKS